jgi:hypothetical protein
MQERFGRMQNGGHPDRQSASKRGELLFVRSGLRVSSSATVPKPGETAKIKKVKEKRRMRRSKQKKFKKREILYGAGREERCGPGPDSSLGLGARHTPLTRGEAGSS